MNWAFSEYQIAWMAYLLAFLVIYWAWAGIVSWIPLRTARQTLKALLAVLLLTPVVSTHIEGWLVPGWLNFFYALLLDQSDELGRTLFNYALAGAGMLAALSLDAGWHRYRQR